MSRVAVAVVIVIGISAPLVNAQQPPRVIESVTLVSPHLDAPLEGTSILVEGQRITAIAPTSEFLAPPGTERIDGRGKWVIPGIIEFHSHATSRLELGRALALGVTTAQTVGRPESPEELEASSNRPDSPSPRLVLVTGFVGEFVERMGFSGVSKPQTAEHARVDVMEMHRNGVRRIKVWQDDGSLWFDARRSFAPISSEAFNGLVRAAHNRDMEVVLHAWRLPFLRQALDAGVDRLIHPVADSLVTEDIWKRVRERELVWTTTMSVILIYGNPRAYARRVLSDQHLSAALSNEVRTRLGQDTSATAFPTDTFMPTLHQNHDLYMEIVRKNTLGARANEVPIVVGSDAPPGVGTHIELELMAEAGLSPLDLLSAATLNGAEALELDDDLGTVEPGKLADLVILNADPLVDVRNWRDIHLVMKGGTLHRPNELLMGSNE